MKSKNIWWLGLRYALLLLLGLFNLALFYFIFTPATVYPVFWILYLFNSGARLLDGSMIFFSGQYAQIIPACVGGAAYYLLLILNLSTPMDIRSRFKSILTIVFSFLILNILRILIFMGLLSGGYQYFDLSHVLTWYFGSTVMVIVIWFGNVWLFNIKSIPVYTDMKRLYNEIKKTKVKRAKTK